MGSRLAPSVFKFITGTEVALRDLQASLREVQALKHVHTHQVHSYQMHVCQVFRLRGETAGEFA